MTDQAKTGRDKGQDSKVENYQSYEVFFLTPRINNSLVASFGIIRTNDQDYWPKQNGEYCIRKHEQSISCKDDAVRFA
jgi:hypothetical protein